MSKVIKIIVAILLFLCLGDMPYGYYQFVRFMALIGFVILAYHSNRQGKDIEVFIFGALALLFQPFFKITLGRQLWNIIDIIVGLGLIFSIWLKPKSQP